MSNDLNAQSLPPSAEPYVQLLQSWQDGGLIQRVWEEDPSVWTGSDESKWLGWLSIAQQQLERSDHLTDLAQDIGAADFSDILLLGMGGSSLCPEGHYAFICQTPIKVLWIIINWLFTFLTW